MSKVLPCPRMFERLDEGVTALAALVFDLAGADLPEELIERKLAGLQGLEVVFGPEGAPQPAVNVMRQAGDRLRRTLRPGGEPGCLSAG